MQKNLIFKNMYSKYNPFKTAVRGGNFMLKIIIKT